MVKLSKMFTKSENQEAEQRSVLIVDDNDHITKMISSFLGMNDYDCTVVNDGKEAMELLKTNQYDSVLLDLSMPEFDGYDILETLKNENPEQLSKIIILTASNVQIENVRRFKELGISSCLQKPVDMDQLLEKIKIGSS